MATKVPRRIKTLSGFLRWAEQFKDGQYLFRGVPNETYRIEASASRRLSAADRSNPVKLLKINQELTEKARLLGHDQLSGQHLPDLALLAELQHFRAATCLIDFTRNALVALWFASEQTITQKEEKSENAKADKEKEKKSDNTKEVPGRVYAVRIDDPARFKTITSELLKKNINYFFAEDKNGRYPLYQWQPKLQNNRIIAQQSVFIFGGAKIEPEDSCIIEANSKQDILKALDKLSGITEATIYPDSDGFARLHVHNNPDFEPDAQGYLQRGIEVHQKGEREEAIVHYTTVISPLSSLEQLDNDLLAWAHNHRGIAYFTGNAVDLAIADFTGAIQLMEDVLIPNTADSTRSDRLKKDLARTYVHRGFAYYWEKKDFDSAINDYTKAIELYPEFAETYGHRGIAHLSRGEFVSAINDYTQLIQLDEGFADAYKERGIAYLSRGDFDRAIDDYTKAIQLDPDDTSTYRHRGLTYLRIGEINSANDDFTKAIQLKPDDANAYYNRSITWLCLQDWEKAKSDLITAKNNGLEITTEFRQDYGNIDDFQQRNDMELPKDIVELLTSQQT